ncbi:PREDICTED: equatorin [Chrysochloris asiatica]|uniref:Equatorin n=1 Tax=Chrysochloris asiatica TaxID=185453 RepID=A0A9B0TG22_CHRAS|nr:PREDICTED: equatorin [Chrysochloris asiatica]
MAGRQQQQREMSTESILTAETPDLDFQPLEQISDKDPNLEEFPDAMPLFKDENKEQEKNKDKVPANEKSGHYKDTKESQANTETSTTKATENPIGEITTEEDTIKEPLEVHDYQIQSSDENYLTKETLGELEDIKLKLMLGISLMSLILFLAILTLCFATLYKLRTLSKHECESQYSVNPELAEMSYFHPTEGVSDTSFSKSAESSTFWGNNSSELRKSGTKKSKSESVTNMLSDDADAYEDAAEEAGEATPTN